MKRGKFAFLSVFLVCIISGIICVSAFAWYIFIYLDPQLDISFEDLSMDLTSIVYAQNPETGEYEEIERLHGTENRVWADLDTIPVNLQNAFISIEDERFRSHGGVDWKRTFGAVIGFATMSDSYGGSTITQQLVKNLTGEDEVRPDRKIKEIIRALKLEKMYSKDQILEMYLNVVFLGNNMNGVQTAANAYFNKDVSQLSLAECAAIAGITQNPTKYNPYTYPENVKERQEIILNKMKELGYITQEECDAAKAEQLNIAPKKEINDGEDIRSYFVEELVQEVINDLMDRKGYSKAVASKMVYSGGLSIYATVDTDVQEAMEEVYEDPSSFQKFSGSVQPESAMVVMDQHTGEIKGVVGGRGEKTANLILNRASQTKRQPGSSFKPLSVYAPAIEEGVINYGSNYEDTPFEGNWPQNESGGFTGPMDIATAVAKSKNTVAVKVLNDLSPETSYKYLTEKLGFSTIVNEEVINGKIMTDIALSPLALGGLTKGVTVREMTGGYAALANGGQYIEPHCYTKIVDNNGKTVMENDSSGTQAFSAETAFITTKLLENAVKVGTGTPAKMSSGMAVAGKTGTTENRHDRWFAGYTPYYTGVVWFGYDNQKSINGATVNPSAKVWRLVMEKIQENKDVKTFDESEPDTVVTAKYCAYTGDAPGIFCATKVGYYKKGETPSKKCSGYHYGGGSSSSSSTNDDDEEEDDDTGTGGGTTEPGGGGTDPGGGGETDPGGGGETDPGGGGTDPGGGGTGGGTTG